MKDWRTQNEEFMAAMATKPNCEKWPGGVYGFFVEKADVATDAKKPVSSSVVTCHYTGKLINGKQFDTSRTENVPAVFRVRDLISGFQVGLTHMHVGDKILVYIPWMQGYGSRQAGDIPPYSTLIFEIELIGIQ